MSSTDVTICDDDSQYQFEPREMDLPHITFTKSHLFFLNQQLSKLDSHGQCSVPFNANQPPTDTLQMNFDGISRPMF
jgi:hypothetical protein